MTHWLYRTAFREIETEVGVRPPSVKRTSPKPNYKKQHGKIIRTIRIVTIDPLGKVIGDTVAVGRNWLERAGNKTHFTTRQSAIINQLLFKEGDKFDSIRVIESERLLRQSIYVAEAKIGTAFNSKKKDSLDVLVTVRDLWTVNGSANVSPTQNNAEFSETNVLGLTHQFRNAIAFNLKTNNSLTSNGSYLIPNIRRTYVAGTLFYNASTFNQGVGVNFDRGFFSPLVKWAGGVNVSTTHQKLAYTVQDAKTEYFDARYHVEDVWMGRGFTVKRGRFNAYADPRVLIASRVYNMQYVKRPSFDLDTSRLNRGNTFYLSSICFSYRSYYKDKNIYAFGKTEDVPEGKMFAVIGGIRVREFSKPMPYYGFKFSYGKHFTGVGYLASNFEYGSFVHNRKSEKGVINTGVHFFNDLWKYRQWGMRQFIDFRLTVGIRRDSTERINMNGDNGLDGFNSETLKGYNRGVLTFANVIYVPYKWLGFQFATILFASFGEITQNNYELLHGKIYQVYGLGVLIRNEFMVIRTIQISFGYYPQMPDHGNDTFKYNSIKVSDLMFNDLYFSKPEFIGYR